MIKIGIVGSPLPQTNYIMWWYPSVIFFFFFRGANNSTSGAETNTYEAHETAPVAYSNSRWWKTYTTKHISLLRYGRLPLSSKKKCRHLNAETLPTAENTHKSMVEDVCSYVTAPKPIAFVIDDDGTLRSIHTLTILEFHFPSRVLCTQQTSL